MRLRPSGFATITGGETPELDKTLGISPSGLRNSRKLEKSRFRCLQTSRFLMNSRFRGLQSSRNLAFEASTPREIIEKSRFRGLQRSRTLIELARILSRSRELIELTRVHSRSMLFESTGFEALRLHWVEACMHVHFERACPKQRSKRVRRSGRSNFEALRSHWLEATQGDLLEIASSCISMHGSR